MASLAIKCAFGVLLLTVVSGYFKDTSCRTREDFNEKYSDQFPVKKLQLPNFVEDLFQSGTKEFISNDPVLELRKVQFKDKFVQMMKVKGISSLQMDGHLSRIRTYYPFCDGPDTENEFYLKLIGSRCITRITDCVVENDAYYFIGKFYQGDMASEETRNSAFKASGITAKISVFHEISNILLGLHLRKAFHLDIRPQNIIAEKFDASKYLFMIKMPHQDMDGEKVKTPIFDPKSKYIAPENIPGMIEKTQKAEIFSLTLTFMVMMSSEAEVFEKLNDTCFSTKFDQTCHSQLITNFNKIFVEILNDKRNSNSKNYVTKLQNCFKTALSLLPDGRQLDLNVFIKGIIGALSGHVAI